MKGAFGVVFAILLLLASPASASAPNGTAPRYANAVRAQASPSPPASGTTGSPTASPSPGEEGNRGGITTGAGIVIAAILVGGLLLMRTRLLRR